MDRRTFLGGVAAAATVSAFPENSAWAQQVPLHEAGARGVRFSLGSPGLGNPSRVADIELLSKRVLDLGWHVQIYMRADQPEALYGFLNQQG